MKNISTKYERGETIVIVEIQRPGIITAIMQDDYGISYRVCYWNNGERKAEWLMEAELKQA